RLGIVPLAALFRGFEAGALEAIEIGEDAVLVGEHQVAAPGGFCLGASRSEAAWVGFLASASVKAGCGACTLYLPIIEPSKSAESVRVSAPPSGSDDVRPFWGPGLTALPARRSAISCSVMGPSISS